MHITDPLSQCALTVQALGILREQHVQQAMAKAHACKLWAVSAEQTYAQTGAGQPKGIAKTTLTAPQASARMH